MSSRSAKYRSDHLMGNVIGFSISYQREAMLPRGLGLEHLLEMVKLLARPLLRQGASLAYGGDWRRREDNFTYPLLDLISAEQTEQEFADAERTIPIGRLYNHSAWPHYLEISPRIEAQWINYCRIIRFTQQDAGFAGSEIVPDSEAKSQSKRAVFNTACTIGAMRHRMNDAWTLLVPDGRDETIPAIGARIVLGGKTTGFSGFVPGIFEEALATLERTGRPLYLLGGFGGATEVLARAIDADIRPPEMTVAWHKAASAEYSALLDSTGEFNRPSLAREPQSILEQLWQKLQEARSSPASTLNTGLSDEETRELMKTHDPLNVVRLVRKGLAARFQLPHLPG